VWPIFASKCAVCVNQKAGGCPARSLPARGIEESVLGRVREAQGGLFDPAEWEQMDRIRQVEEIKAVVERIGYDGGQQQVTSTVNGSIVSDFEQTARAMGVTLNLHRWLRC
jgi:hypothetical protein